MALTSEQKATAKIMLVDDEEAIVRLLSLVLRQHGLLNVTTCTHSDEAVDIFERLHPDVVVLDLNMPKVSGLQLLEEMKQRDEEIPVLIVSGYGDRRLRIDCLNKGARDFIEKPFDLETVTRILNQLELRLLHNRVKAHNAELERKVAERTAELQREQLETARRLAQAAEYRDDDTGVHVKRMSLCVALLAEMLGMSQEECTLLRHASALHDVGKIAIPDQILLKPGKLTPEEFAIMKTHTTKGAELLSGGSSELLRRAEVIARSHHERWDGTGYPDGLKGEEIPLCARLVAIADVFDALTSERPYKKAWAPDEAVAEILRGRGAHFMPELVDAFIAVLPRVLELRDRLRPESPAGNHGWISGNDGAAFGRATTEP